MISALSERFLPFSFSISIQHTHLRARCLTQMDLFQPYFQPPKQSKDADSKLRKGRMKYLLEIVEGIKTAGIGGLMFSSRTGTEGRAFESPIARQGISIT